MADQRRKFIGGSTAREPMPPSAYTVQRNAIKDAEASAARVDAKRRADEAAERAKVTQEIALQQLEIRRAEFRIKQIEKRNEQQATLHKLQMAELHKEREGQFLGELNKLDPADFGSHSKRLALMEKYHGIPELSDFGKQALSAWDGVMKLTVTDEMVKRRESVAKKAALEEKRANAVGDKALDGFTKARTKLAGAMAVKSDQESAGEIPTAKTIGEIASLQQEIRVQGERLKTAKPDYATEVDDEIRGIESFNKLEHDTADSALASLNESKKYKPDAPELKQARIRLNTWKKATNAPEIVDVTTGEMKPNPFLTKPAEKPAAAPAAATAASTAPTPPAPQEAPYPVETDSATPAPVVAPSAPAPRTMFVPGSTPTPDTSPTGASAFTPKPSAQKDRLSAPERWADSSAQWDEVAKRRDAAIAERNKSLDVLIETPNISNFHVNPVGAISGLRKINTASIRASSYNDEANRAQDQLDALETERSAQATEGLLSAIGGQAEYDRLLASKQPAVAPAPVVVAPVAVPAPVSVSESDGAVPAPAPKKVIKATRDANGNWIIPAA